MRWLELKTQDVFRFVNDYVEGFSKVKENCKELTNKFSLSISTGVANTFIFFFFFFVGLRALHFLYWGNRVFLNLYACEVFLSPVIVRSLELVNRTIKLGERGGEGTPTQVGMSQSPKTPNGPNPEHLKA